MKYLYCSIILLLICFESSGQNYTRDAGIRTGEGFFVSYRVFFDENTALEGFAGFARNGIRIIALREYFKPLATKRSDNLKFVYGYGIHAGLAYTNKFRFLYRTYYHDWRWTPQFGLDGLAGIEYGAPDLPLLVSVAAQPYFEYSLNRYFQMKALNLVVCFKYRF